MANWGTVRGVVIHHTVHARPDDHTGCVSIARRLPRTYHDDQGAPAVAYNEVWCPHGKMVEGRGFGSTNDANGCRRANSTYYAIAVIDTHPSPSRWDPILRPRITAVRKRWPTATRVVPHRDMDRHVPGCDVATACPGDRMADWCRNYVHEEEDDMAQFTEDQARFLRVLGQALFEKSIAGYRVPEAVETLANHLRDHPGGDGSHDHSHAHTHTATISVSGS